MRDIKFRALTLDNRIIEVGEVSFFTDGHIIVNDEIPVKQLIEYTGLKDKNGKEIYEGDVVKAIEREQGKTEGYERREIVYWNVGGPRLFSKAMSDFTVKDDMKTIRDCRWRTRGAMDIDLYYELVDFEVIGNIYENPELLK